MKISMIRAAIATVLVTSAFGIQAKETLLESLMIDNTDAKIGSHSLGDRVRDITMMKGERRKDALRRIIGDRYRDSASPMFAQGTDVNSEYYKSVKNNKKGRYSISSQRPRSYAIAGEQIPADPYFIEWQLNNFQRSQALLSQAAPNAIAAFNLTIPFAPSVVGVIDAEFSGNIDINVVDGMGFYAKDDGIENPGIPRIHESYDNGSTKMCGEHGSGWHGLGVASISSAHMNNGVGMAGYSQSDVVYAKAMQCGFGWSDDIARAIYWQAGASKAEVPNSLYVEDIHSWRQIKPVDVINMSLGGEYECPDEYHNALHYAVLKNVPVVAAAGNENNDGVSVPAVCDGTIGVVALDGDGNKAEYSNYGNGADIAVVGTAVAAYMVPSQYEEGDDITTKITQNMRYMSGTSMAAPIVTAAVAQIRQIDISISSQEILTVLQETADPFPEGSNCNSEYYCGAGILNAERAIQVVSGREVEEQAVATPAANNVSECNETTIALNATGLKKICETYNVNVTGLRYMARDFENLSFEFYEVESGADIQPESQPVAASTVPFVTLHELKPDDHDYIVRACGGTECKQMMDVLMEVKAYETNICN